MTAMQTYKVKKGDTMMSIAKQFQHKKWETIWQAPENKTLASKRKKPDALQLGDQLTIPPNEKEQEEAKNARTLKIGGKQIVLREKEFDAFQKEMLTAVKKAVLAAEIRTESARSYWDSFDELNKDQKVVSWCIGLLGPKLPPESLITKAEAACKKLQSAVASGDFKKIHDEMANVVGPVNDAYTQMMKYAEGVTSRGEKWLTGLEFTRDTSFDIVTAIATVEMGGKAGGAVAGGASNMVKSAAGELGKYIAGTSGGGAAATKAILVDGILGAASGAVDTFMSLKGEELLKGAAMKVAVKITSKWVGPVGTTKIALFLFKRLKGALKGAVEAAVKSALKAAKGDLTLDKLMDEVVTDVGLGSVLNGFDPFIDRKFGPAACNKLIAMGLKLTGKVDKKKLAEIVAGLVKGKLKDGVAEAIKFAFEKAKGDESVEELGETAADAFAKENFDELEKEILKHAQTD